MAYSVNWATKVVTIPQSDLTLVSPGVYELDVLTFWAEIHDIQDDEGMPYLDIMRSNAPVTLSGLTLARTVEVINGYTIEFEDGQYQVNLTGANNNLLDTRVQNQVSLNANNSAGLQVVSVGSGLSNAQDTTLTNIESILSDIEGGYDADGLLRIILSAVAGKGGDDGNGTYRYRDIADTKDRIVAPVSGSERTSVTLDGS